MATYDPTNVGETQNVLQGIYGQMQGVAGQQFNYQGMTPLQQQYMQSVNQQATTGANQQMAQLYNSLGRGVGGGQAVQAIGQQANQNAQALNTQDLGMQNQYQQQAYQQFLNSQNAQIGALDQQAQGYSSLLNQDVNYELNKPSTFDAILGGVAGLGGLAGGIGGLVGGLTPKTSNNYNF